MFRRTVLVSALALVGALLFASTSSPVTPALTAANSGHCKDASHLSVKVAPGNATLVNAADVIVVKQQRPTPTCVNDRAYAGSLYVFVIKGKSGLRMLPSGATFVRQQFAAKAGHGVELDHTFNGVFVDFRDFTDAARAKVVAELVAFGQ